MQKADLPKLLFLAHTSQEGDTGSPLQGNDKPTEDAEDNDGRMDERPNPLAPTVPVVFVFAFVFVFVFAFVFVFVFVVVFVFVFVFVCLRKKF